MMPKPSKTDPSLEVKQETGVMTQETSLELARIMVLVAVCIKQSWYPSNTY